jgi:hypothetical protein
MYFFSIGVIYGGIIMKKKKGNMNEKKAGHHVESNYEYEAMMRKIRSKSQKKLIRSMKNISFYKPMTFSIDLISPIPYYGENMGVKEKKPSVNENRKKMICKNNKYN